MISSLFEERSRFVVIGLTGRTGSGCTTAATILEEDEPSFPKLSDVNYQSQSFFNGLDSRRYEVVSKFTNENYTKFVSIKVSDLISTYILSMNSTNLSEFICSQKKSTSKSKIDNMIRNGAFSKTFLNTKKLKSISQKILDHSKPFELTKAEQDKFFTFMRLIRKFTKEFKEEMRSLEIELYINVYQAAGNSIRRTGEIQNDYESKEFTPESVFHLPETINRTIKIIRKVRSKALIVIDAIRNPYEAMFFKERYAAFYLMSINAPNEDRKKYLQNIHKFTVDKFDELEQKESGKSNIDDSDFITQNVQRCIELSDIHIFNPRNELDNNNVLKAQLAWYYALILHPGLITPTSLERVMQIAYTAKSNSGCISRQVGAVVTDKNFSVKSVGWNDVAKGQIPCNLRTLDGLEHSFDSIAYSLYEQNNTKFREEAKKDFSKINKEGTKGKSIAYCFKDIKNNIDSKGNQVHTRSLHAEENAFLQLVKYGGVGIEGGKLFTTASPCELCSKKAYQLGIKEIVFIDPYPGIAIDHILTIGNSKPKLTQFRGAVGRGYHQLYEPIISYKDELNYLKTNN